MDLKIKQSNINFKSRVAGIVINDNKVLAVKMMDNPYFCLPGGHIKFGESSDEAVLREMEEEINCKFKINKIIAIIENFYEKKGSRFHEIGYYYLVDNLEKLNFNDYSRIENDEGILKNLEFKWISLDELHNYDFRPENIKTQLINNFFNLNHYIIKE